MKNFVWGAVAEVPAFARNTLATAADLSKYTPWEIIWNMITSPFKSEERKQKDKQAQKNLVSWIKDIWQNLKQGVENTWLYNKESTAAKVWTAATDILGSVVWTPALKGAWAAKWIFEWMAFIQDTRFFW